MEPYLQVVAKKVGHAFTSRTGFTSPQHMSAAIDQMHRDEVRTLRAQGRLPLLTKT